MTDDIKTFFGAECTNGLIKLESYLLNEPVKAGQDFRVGPFLLRCVATDALFTYAVQLPDAAALQSRYADDPKLAQFYLDVVNKMDKLRRYYLNQQHTATVNISQSMDMPNELAVHVAELGRATAKLIAHGAIRKIFMDAWQDLNDEGDK